jgi:hypothetical protein
MDLSIATSSNAPCMKCSRFVTHEMFKVHHMWNIQGLQIVVQAHGHRFTIQIHKFFSLCALFVFLKFVLYKLFSCFLNFVKSISYCLIQILIFFVCNVHVNWRYKSMGVVETWYRGKFDLICGQLNFDGEVIKHHQNLESWYVGNFNLICG